MSKPKKSEPSREVDRSGIGAHVEVHTTSQRAWYMYTAVGWAAASEGPASVTQKRVKGVVL